MTTSTTPTVELPPQPPTRLECVSRAQSRADRAYARSCVGYREHRRARSTGTLVVLVNNREAGLDDPDDPELRWFLVCDGHGGCVGFGSYQNARSFMSAPEEWCPTCQGFDEETR